MALQSFHPILHFPLGLWLGYDGSRWSCWVVRQREPGHFTLSSSPEFKPSAAQTAWPSGQTHGSICAVTLQPLCHHWTWVPNTQVHSTHTRVIAATEAYCLLCILLHDYSVAINSPAWDFFLLSFSYVGYQETISEDNKVPHNCYCDKPPTNQVKSSPHTHTHTHTLSYTEVFFYLSSWTDWTKSYHLQNLYCLVAILTYNQWDTVTFC